MTLSDADDRFEIGQIETASVSRVAEMSTIDLVAWIVYVVIFAVVPFTVVLFRSEMLGWHYYVAGATFLGGALAICAMNLQQ